MPLQISNDDAGFKVLFHNNPNPMWIVEVDTLQFKEVNEAATNHYGYSRHEFLHDITLSDIHPACNRPEMNKLIKRIRHNETITRELTHIKKDKSCIYVHITSYTINYYGSRCRMVIINDVTEQKTKDIKLTDALNRIKETLESITDGFITLDSELKVTYWNKEAARILSISQNTVLHKKLWAIYPYYKQLEVYKQFNEALKTRQTAKFEEYIAPLKKWICFTVYPNDGLAVYFQDITGQKHDEEQINLKNASLDKIAHINSHIIRKPLANILGIINSFEGMPCDEEHMAEPIKLLKKSATDLDNIIKDINSRVEDTIK